MIDTGVLGSEEAEALYMLGTAYLRAGAYPLAIQVLAQGSARSQPRTLRRDRSSTSQMR